MSYISEPISQQDANVNDNKSVSNKPKSFQTNRYRLKDCKQEDADTMENEFCIGFWRFPCVFNNWTPSAFNYKEVDYCCAEQALMHQKSLMMKDEKTAEKILATTNPASQKALGRKVKGFDQEKWDKECDQLMFEIVLCKFVANADLKAQLIATGTKLLVECSNLDRVWAIGITSKDLMKHSESLESCKNAFRGQNKLGNALMKARDVLNKPSCSF
jgi:ribA/ribD-fused uncharacterized protein